MTSPRYSAGFPRQHFQTYSLLKALTGLAIAALIAWKLTVSMAISRAVNPATANIHQLILIRYAKSSSHLFIAHHAIGDAMMMAIITSLRKSVESIFVISCTDAPKTFLIPISLIRWLAV